MTLDAESCRSVGSEGLGSQVEVHQAQRPRVGFKGDDSSVDSYVVGK